MLLVCAGAARDHGSHAVPESGKANHHDVDEQEEYENHCAEKMGLVREICGCPGFPENTGGTAIVMVSPTVSTDFRLPVTCHNPHFGTGGTGMGFQGHAAPRSKGHFGRGGRAGDRCHLG